MSNYALKPSLSQLVAETLEAYLKDTSGPQADLHKTVLSAVEAPLIKKMLEHTSGNQTLAANILGISRTTLRNKIEQYALSSE